MRGFSSSPAGGLLLRSSLLVLAALLVACAELSAQQFPPLEANQRVRLRTATYWDVVWLEQLTADSLIAQRFNGGGEVRVPLAAIERLEISRGYPAPGARILAGGGIGLLAGVGVGAALGYAAGDNRRCSTSGDFPDIDGLFRGCGITAREKATLFGALGALPGALVGVMIAAGTAPGETWERVVLPAQVSVAPLREGGLVVVVSRPF